MRHLLIFMIVLTPAAAFATSCYKHSWNASAIGSGCPEGYIPLTQQNIDQDQHDVDILNGLAAQAQQQQAQQNGDDQQEADNIAAQLVKWKNKCHQFGLNPAKTDGEIEAKGGDPQQIRYFCSVTVPNLAQKLAEASQEEGITPDPNKADGPP